MANHWIPVNFIKMDLVGVFNLHLIYLVEFISAWEKIREKRDLQSSDWQRQKEGGKREGKGIVYGNCRPLDIFFGS
ncbi:hypothetical protein MtrunA17_Chr6g0468611 [Medicago truncatula]|uniref:Transmembrane protein, putative n=1 Tax=Medicago truncatula TaxID=3880 RepID=A0A072U973_MEDTR|nr:transmembrane protein, putative [Medicago truncatula]RHN51443.1 hypothetical protein MtrunA17_Chr6g0468611 [Medicago truncatula]